MTGRVRKLLTDNCPFGEADNCEACFYERYDPEKKWYECGHPERYGAPKKSNGKNE